MSTRPIESIRDLGALARGRRLELGLTQAELASRAGVSRQWVSGFEAGKPGAELRLVIRLLNALDLHLLVDGGGGDRWRQKPPQSGIDLDALLDGIRKR